MTAGSLAQLDRHAALHGFTPAEDAHELQERRLVPFADRRALRPRMEMGIDADDEGPFDDAA